MACRNNACQAPSWMNTGACAGSDAFPVLAFPKSCTSAAQATGPCSKPSFKGTGANSEPSCPTHRYAPDQSKRRLMERSPQRLERPPVVVVTGASAGVGRATAFAFAERGYAVGLIAR